MALQGAREVPERMGRLLRARLRRWQIRLRRAAWRIVGLVAIALALSVVLATAVVMLLYALASALGQLLSVPTWAGCGILAGLVLCGLTATFFVGARRLRRALGQPRVARAERELKESGRKIIAGLATSSGLLVSALVGFFAVELTRSRAMRRVAFASLGMARTVGRATRALAGTAGRALS
ncbi:MAG: hypothetical protein R3F56_12000 [Planctomycetota bacterium]